MNNIKIKFIDAETEALYKTKDLENQNETSITQKGIHAGFQLIARSIKVNARLRTVTYGTGVRFQLPENTFGDVRTRSSVSKMALDLTNSAGVVEASYTGEVFMVFRYDRQLLIQEADYAVDINGDYIEEINDEDMVKRSELVYEVGNTIGQLIVLERFAPTGTKYNIVQELDATVRGNNGFGSTGK